MLAKKTSTDTLLKSTKNGDIEKVKALLEKGNSPCVADQDGFTPLHWACRRGDPDLVSLLLSADANVNAQDSHKFTPLHWAASKGDFAICSILIKHGSNLNERDEYGFTPLHWAANKGHESLARELVEHHAALNIKDENGLTPLHWCAREGHYPVAKILIKYRADLEAQDDYGVTPLHCATLKGHEKVTQLLVHRGANVNARNKKGSTPLHSAASEGHERIAGFLHRSGADMNARNFYGFTPLHWAARRGCHRAVAVLISKGAQVNCPNNEGGTPLHCSCRTGHVRATLLLIQEGADVTIGDNEGNTPLHHAVMDNHEKITKLLSDNNVDANVQNDAGCTPLHLACEKDLESIALLLVDRAHASIYVVNNEGKTPIELASERLAAALQASSTNAGVTEENAPKPSRAAKSHDVYPVSKQQEMAQMQARIAGMGVSSGLGRAAVNAPAPHTQSRTTPVPSHVNKQQNDAPFSPNSPLPHHAMQGEEQQVEEEDYSDRGRSQSMISDWEVDFEEVELDKLIGKGGYGEVYRGNFRGTDVAVKKLLVQKMEKKHLREFRHEINLMSKLRHPNVVLFMGASTRPPNLCVITEFMPRSSLFQVLRDRTIKYDWQLMVKMATDAARGMNYLHCSKPPILHRDLKSLNLLVDDAMNVKVCDFGLTKVKQRTYMLTRVGTPQWMAPEVLRNEQYNEKADVFSYGCVLWELYTRQDPYKGLNAMEVGRRVCNEGLRLPIPPQCPAILKSLITRCFQEDPNLRPSFREILEELKKF
eukprot:GCRY01003861.1.p1 GENE.GCRY01003861.1~~GCRY01003861.1.p1  ORF type:complete len:766 (+),score=168.79 GCRY01003861.1:243-2540(+)